MPAVLRHRGFAALLGADAVTTLGDALSKLTLILLVTQRTHSTVAVAGIAVSLALPSVVLGPVAGALVDRWDRRRSMIGSDVLRAGLLTLLATLCAAGSVALPLLYVITLAHAAIGTTFEPARAALQQSVLPESDQLRGTGLVQSAIVVSELVGVSLAGLLVTTAAGPAVSFGTDAATFAVSATLVATIRVAVTHDPRSEATVRRDILRSVRSAWSSPTLRALIFVFAGLSVALGPMAVLMTPYIVDDLHVAPTWIGLIQSGDTVGGLLGGVAISVAARRLSPGRLLAVGLGGLALVVMAIGLVRTIPGLLVAHILFGLLIVAVQSGVGTLVQTRVAPTEMGRFTSIMALVPGAVTVAAMTGAGGVATAVGVPTVFVASGVVLAIITAYAGRLTGRDTEQCSVDMSAEAPATKP